MTETTLRTVPIEALRVSQTHAQTERRKHLDGATLREMAESIKSHGIISAPIVRPLVNGTIFEIVAGERRYLAAKIAKLREIEVSVRELTDEQVLEIQLIENLQREGLHELAEAEGYEQLIKLGRSADEVAAKVGRSRGYVYSRVKLLDLCKEAREAFYDGKLSFSIALVIARIPAEELQAKALEHILKPFGDNAWKKEPLNYRDALAYVQAEFMTRLSEAPFPRDDATLVPAAGTCGACPKRTGNQAELFGDVKGADVCTDPGCFKEKRAAWQKIQLARARETDMPVITGAAARKVQSPWSSELTGYVRPGDKCQADPKKRTYAQLLGKDAENVGAAMLQNPESGKFSKVLKAEDVAKVLKPKGIKVAVAEHAAATSRADAERKRDAAKQEQEAKFRETLFRAVMAAAPAKLGRQELEVIAAQLCEQGEDQEFWELIGLPKFPRYGREQQRKAIAKLNDADLHCMLIALPFTNDLNTWNDGDELKAYAKFLGIDPDKVRKELAAAESAKPEEPGKNPVKTGAKSSAARKK